MFTKSRKIAGVISGLLMAPIAWGAALQDVKFSELPGDRVEIRLQFDEAPSSPQGYTIEQPARIVLDFADVENALSQKKFNMAMGSVNSAVVVAGGNRTRLIVNMSELEPYATRIEGSDLVMEVGGAARAAEAAPTVTAGNTAAVLSKPKNRFDKAVSEIQNIDFRRGDAGEGKVIITLSNPGVSIDVEEVASGIEVGFLQTELPDALRRKLDVTDFATPVQMIDASTGSLRTVLKIDAQGEYDYLAYQADNEYVVSVKPLTKAEIEEKRAKFAYTGEKLSLNFQNIEVRSVLQLIADFTDLNLVASDTVKGSITLRLDNVPWDQALELVLKTKGLDKRLVGNVLMVAPAAEIAERERQELATQKQLEELAPLRTEYIRVRYANARELFDLFIPEGGLGGQGGGGAAGNQRNSTGTILSDRGHAIVDERTNSIILTDTEEKINDFRRVVEQIDIPIRQVLIESRIVIANNNFRKELGARVNFGGTSRSIGREAGYSGSMEEFFNNSGDNGAFRLVNNDGASVTQADTNAVNLGLAEKFGSIAASVITGDVRLGLELQALEQAGYAEIVSQPKVITGDKQQASIESGKEVAYQEASASGATAIAFKEAVLKLDVTPQITPDDNIIMDLKINQDSIGEYVAGPGGSQVPVIDVTELNTQVLVADGQTVVLGGIFQTETVRSTSKVPLLGDIPVVGRLFKRNVNEDEKRELIIFITPRIMSSSLTNN